MLTNFADWFTYVFLKMPREILISDAIHFFVYDIVKIYILLISVIFVVSFIQTWLAPERIKAFLSKRNKLTGHILASFLGAIAPFCSCSSIPLFIGFLESGIPLGITMTFLVASPMITPQGIVLLWSLFGFKVAFLYVAMGLLIAIISGLIIDRLHLEKGVEDFVYQIKLGKPLQLTRSSFKERLQTSWTSVVQIFKTVAPWVALGVAIGAFIHGYAPAELIVKYAGKDNPFAVVIATIIGIPLYSSSEGVIPIVQALWAKGLPLGTTLAFMMSVVGLSLPEMIMLRKVLKPKLLAIFIGVVGMGIIVVGYIFNWIM